MSPFTRDLHLSDLGLELWEAGELDAEGARQVEQHLETCGACRARVAARAMITPPAPPWAREAGAAPAAPPPAEVPAAEPEAARLAVLPGGRPAPAEPTRAPAPAWRWVAPLAGVAALAAGALAMLAQPPPPDEFAARGAGLDLEVFRDSEAGVEPLADRARVRAGDRLGFRIRSAEPGHALVFGVDAHSAAWAGWPQGEAPAAEAVTPGPSRALPTAVVLDDAPGGERIVAVRCPGPFTLADVAPRFPAAGAPAPLDPGCVWSELRLTRDAP